MYWDKAGTAGAGAFTVGVQMWEMRTSPRFVIVKVVRGQWESSERERIIWDEAELAGRQCMIMVEQEPGSGGKESAESTIRNLAGFKAKADRPSGDKTFRADPFSVQVNAGNVGIVNGPWLNDYVEEMRYFPLGRFKDQIDASSGAFNYLATGKRVGAW
jgi:predicted phage terminase large subunit-like protein